MKIDSKFIKAVQASCESSLVDHGFHRLRRDGVVFNLSKDYLGWVGLNVGKHDNFVRINPSVGIHCVPIMKMVADLSGEKYQLGRYATFSVHLGELCPDVEAFEFHIGQSMGPEANRLAAIYETYGIPFMRAHATYEKILPILQRRASLLGGYPQRVVAALYLAGRKEDARKFVIAHRAKYASQPMVLESFDRFALPFLKITAEKGSD